MGFADVFPTPLVLADAETEDFSMKAAIAAQKKEEQRKDDQMHVYNAWLPQWMVKEVKEEPQRFHKLVDIMREEILRVDSPAARLATTKWIPVINAYVFLLFIVFISCTFCPWHLSPTCLVSKNWNSNTPVWIPVLKKEEVSEKCNLFN